MTDSTPPSSTPTPDAAEREGLDNVACVRDNTGMNNTTFTDYRIVDDNMTRWAFLVIDINGPTMFEVHRPGCRDLFKHPAHGRHYAITTDEAVHSSCGPNESEIASLIDRTFYGGDGSAVDESDVRRMPCLKRQ